MSAAVLRCGRARVAVEADDALLDTLTAACHPWITSSPADHAPPGIWAVHVGPSIAGEAVPSHTGTAVYLGADQRTLHLPASSGCVRPLVRLLRALIRRQLAADGAIFLDAAVLTVNGTGVALLGGAGAGKTTTLIATLHRHPGALVANDDASLHAGAGSRVIARGYPRAIEVRREVLPHLTDAAGLLTAAAETDSPKRALYLTPHRLAAALGTALAETAKLSALILLAHGTARPEAHRLTAEAAASAVAAHCAVADPYESWLQPYLPTPAPGAEQGLALAQAVPVWRLAQPLTALATSADLIADLPLRPGGSR
ncbi:hypothetical protein [Streptomyces lydicus]|uniref:hypothetical protein n=1 Tax=Streptomyces lydicus TaxID=47763 RepID=UPI0013E98009|nr:hypothetical protein [Streptomyces lydicus]MCZ1012152.1 hypothetical protein [Streptomyces lydicus]